MVISFGKVDDRIAKPICGVFWSMEQYRPEDFVEDSKALLHALGFFKVMVPPTPIWEKIDTEKLAQSKQLDLIVEDWRSSETPTVLSPETRNSFRYACVAVSNMMCLINNDAVPIVVKEVAIVPTKYRAIRSKWVLQLRFEEVILLLWLFQVGPVSFNILLRETVLFDFR